MTAEEKIMRKLYIIQKSLFNIWDELCQSQQLFGGKATEMLIEDCGFVSNARRA